MKIIFEKIIPNDSQIQKLASLLLKRKYLISHDNSFEYNDHKKFVTNNPYISWYLLYKNETLIGSLYIQSDNSIGIDLTYPNKEDLNTVIAYIKKNYKPLSPIKSLRRGDFFINVSSHNKLIIELLNKLNKREIQRSFLI